MKYYADLLKIETTYANDVFTSRWKIYKYVSTLKYGFVPYDSTYGISKPAIFNVLLRVLSTKTKSSTVNNVY